MRGMLRAPKTASLMVLLTQKLMNKFLIFLMSGLILAQRMPLFCVIVMMDPKTAWLIFIWKAPISIAVGSILRCCNPVAPAAMRPIAEC